MAAYSFDNREKFELLFFNLSELNQINKENHHSTLNSLLDEFNSLNYKNQIIHESAHGSQLISSVIKQVPADDSFLAAKASRLIVNLIRKQKIAIFQEDILTCADWFIKALSVCSDIVLCDILEGFSAILKGNASVLAKYHSHLFQSNGLLSNILQSTTKCDLKKTLNSPSDLTLYVLKCFESLVNINEDAASKNNEEPLFSNNHLEYCGNIFLKYLYQSQTENQDGLNYSQILITSLSGTRFLIQHSNEWCCSKLGDIIGAIKVHIFYGLNKGENILPQKVLPSQQPIPENVNSASKIGRGGKMTRSRKQRANNKKSSGASIDTKSPNENKMFGLPEDSYFLSSNYSWAITSESDISDSESNVVCRIIQNQCRVRQKALELLLAMTKVVSRHEFFGYWHSLMPSTPNDNSRTLSTCILSDPSPRCRIGALTILTTLLSGSRNYLWRADNSEKAVTAFTPFSVVLGGILSALHNSLKLALSEEQSLPVIIQILKCCSALIQSTPYHRLESGLITNLVCVIKRFTKHKDTSVQVAALIALSCVVAVQPSIPEFIELMLKSIENDKSAILHDSKNANSIEINYKKNSSGTNLESDDLIIKKDYTLSDEEFEDEDIHEEDASDSNIYQSDTTNMPWLIQICLGNLGVGKEQAPVNIRIESLNVLAALGSSYFSLFEGHLDLLSCAIKNGLLDQHLENKMHAGKCLDTIAYAMNAYLNNKDINKKITANQCYTFWQSLLNPLMSLIQDLQNSLTRSIACDCLGNIGNEVFKQFPRDKQILVVTNLFGCTKDSEVLVQAAAVRALAVCVEFPVLREDFGFIMDTADAIINLMKESSLQIKIKAYWSLGNLSDALVYAVLEEHEEISEIMLKTLLQIAIDGTKDNDRVKFNAMRAVGNLLKILNRELIHKLEWKSLINESISRLTNPSGAMKVIWNACYALGNILRNNFLFENADGSEWQKRIYTSLNNFVIKSPNFKVRINAAAALAVIGKREHYGPHYLPTWSSLILALDCTNNMEDFTEYKHRDNLVDQICISLAHLINLSEIDDFSNLYNIASPNIEVIRMDMSRVIGRLLPERSSKLISACTHIQTLLIENQMTNEQKHAADIIASIFAI